ncbi:MAG TPA: DUF2069 domain-containing protein [Acidiferrobacteraceae bacterium]|nr:DUF2069 domain-containing protein [Acidiferrobacteraceae bacterium]
MTAQRAHHGALLCYGLLMALIGAWELGFARATGGVPPLFWFTVKELPLLFAVPGLWAGRLHTFEWSGMLIILYFVDGVMNITTKRHQLWTLHAALPYATLETLLAVAFFALALSYLRAGKRAAASARGAAQSPPGSNP